MPLYPDRVFYHGSYDQLDDGTEMVGKGAAYEAQWAETDFYAVLERYRPENCLPHRNAVFMVDDIEDIDNAGGATDWVLEVVTAGEVTRHCMHWSTEISCLLSDGHDVESAEVRQAAENYWAGKPHEEESVWEYLAPSATVVRSYEFEDAPPSLSSGFNP